MASVQKPPYKVPLVAEIVNDSKLTVVSTFSGIGGSCLGFRMAGMAPKIACEYVPAAIAAYRLANPTTPVMTDDIRQVSGDEIARIIGVPRGEIDVLEGSPPCSSFSLSGKGSKGWGQEKSYSGKMVQRTDDLFDEYLRLLAELRPRAFIAENVKGLSLGHSRGMLTSIVAEAVRLGYVVKVAVLSAAAFGVPQARERLFIQGVRNDLGIEPSWPKMLPFVYSINDATSDLPTEVVTDNGKGDWFAGNDAAPSIERFAIYQHWKSIKPGESSAVRFNLHRCDHNKPAPTIVATAANLGAASVTHGYQARKFSVNEIRRLSSFPDDFPLNGSYADRIERMGRSVPPLLMYAIAKEMRSNIFGGN